MMNFTKLLPVNPRSISSKIERILRSGGIVIVPTDTVYGILARADKKDAIRKVFELKKRPQEKAFPIFVKSIAEARKYAYISDAKAKFLEKIWPGPITVVFNHKEKLPSLLTGGKDTIGIRIPNHPFLFKLLEALEFPLLQTSANISDRPPAKNLQELKTCFGDSKGADLFIDGGPIEGKASTVVDFSGISPVVLRTGLVTKEELDRLFHSIQ